MDIGKIMELAMRATSLHFVRLNVRFQCCFET